MKHKLSLIIIFVAFFAFKSNAQLEQEALVKIEKLNKLISEANATGIDTEKEKMTVRIAEIFLSFANWDESNKATNVDYFKLMPNFKDNATTLADELPDYERSEVIKILDQAIENIGLVIDGTHTRKSSPKVDYSKVILDGNKLTQDGRPVFLADHIWKPSTYFYQEYFGAMEGAYIAPSHVTENGVVKQWVIDGIKNGNNNIGYVFVSHNAIPQWAYDRYDNFRDGERHYGTYDIDNPGAREMYSQLFAGVVPHLKGKRSSALGYMLFNEPSFFTQKGNWNSGEVSEYTHTKFKTWLKEKHKNITNLNDLWGTSFSSFDNVSISIPIEGRHQGTPMWYDWMVFNNWRITEYFRFMKNEIHKHDPDALFHIKLMPWLWTGDKKDHGIDFESLTRLSGISGCDAQAMNSNIGGSHKEWMDRYSFEWKEICMMFDFFKSACPDQIIVDSETHFLSTVHFRDLYLDPAYARATYWLAHMHGMSSGENWVWGRNADGSIKDNVGEGHAGSNMQQPAIMNEMHAAMIDLNAFSEEITAIQQMRKPIRVFYSLANAIQRSSYMNDVYDTYEAVHFEGIPLGFATDSILIEEKHSDWDVILIRKNEVVTQQEFNWIQAYLNGGGTVIMDELSCKKDEYGKTHPSFDQSVGTIITITSIEDMTNKAIQVVETNGNAPFLTVDESNAVGKKGCIWRCVKNEDGKRVLSIVNAGKTSADITVSLPSGESISFINLLNGTEVKSSFTLKPYEVMFCVEDTGTDPITHTIPGIIEAEDYTLQEGVKTEACSEGGENIGYVENGDYVIYTISVDESSSYILKYHSASKTGATIVLTLDGNELSTTEIANTGGWQNWGYFTETVFLEKGQHSLKLVAQGEPGFLWNLNKITFEKAASQTIELKKGWNLVSFYVIPSERLTGTVFANADIVKTFDGFYSSAQPEAFNSLHKIEAGKGYLVYNSIDETIEITGTEVHDHTSQILNGWNLIGITEPISAQDYINKTDAIIIKDFEGFYEKGNALNSLTELKVGKAYFVKK